MAKIVRLTESDLTRIVKRVIKEQKYLKSRDMEDWMDDERGTHHKHSDIEDFDSYDEEEFDDYDTFSEKHPESSRHFNWDGVKGKDIFNKYKDTYGPLKVRTRRKMD